MYTVMYDSTNDILAVYTPYGNILGEGEDFLIVNYKSYGLGYINIIKNASNYINTSDLKNEFKKIQSTISPYSNSTSNIFMAEWSHVFYCPINLGKVFINIGIRNLIPVEFDNVKYINTDVYIFFGNFNYNTKFIFTLDNVQNASDFAQEISKGNSSSIDALMEAYVYGNYYLIGQLEYSSDFNFDLKFNKIVSNDILFLPEASWCIDKNSFPLIPENIPKSFKLAQADKYFVV